MYIKEENEQLREELRQNLYWKEQFEELCHNETSMSEKEMDGIILKAAKVIY